jgi:hypothetical protein
VSTDSFRVLGADRAETLERLCDAIVPGSAAVGPSVYIDALVSGMPPPVQAFALASIDELGAAGDLAPFVDTPGFGFVRALAIEAYYSDFVAPGRDAPGAWRDIDFNSPLATRLAKDWSFLGIA